MTTTESSTPETDAFLACVPELEGTVEHELARMCRDLEQRLHAATVAESGDKARLDWLEGDSTCYWVKVQSQPHGNVIYDGRGDLRNAIDAAMNQPKEPDKICRTCWGDGIEERGNGVQSKCSTCHGTGRITKTAGEGPDGTQAMEEPA